MSSKNQNNKLEFVTMCQTLAAGVLALPDKEITLEEKSFTPAEAAAPLQAFVAARAGTTTTSTAFHKAVQVEALAEAAALAMIALLKGFLQARFGKSNPVLESVYGLEPAKKPQKSVAAKASGIAKSKATRAKLGTKGSKQKKAALAEPTESPALPPAPAKPQA